MRYVPSLPPAAGVHEGREVKQPVAVRHLDPVTANEATALVAGMYAREAARQPVPASPPQLPQEKRGQGEDRRKVCRRVQHLPVLEELRSGIERRHHTQRGTDFTEHIDINA